MAHLYTQFHRCSITTTAFRLNRTTLSITPTKWDNRYGQKYVNGERITDISENTYRFPWRGEEGGAAAALSWRSPLLNIAAEGVPPLTGPTALFN